MKQCLVILGAHRSGTSALMGSLHRMGIYLGSRYIVDHYEHTDIVTANDVLLNRLDSAWDDPFALPERWWRQEQLADVKSGLGSIVDREFGGRALWGLKDPRLCVLLPLWLELLKLRRIEPLFIIALRNPFEIARSHTKRDGFSTEKGLVLWLNQILSAEQYSRGFKRCFCRFDDILRDPEAALERFRMQLGFSYPRPLKQGLGNVRAFLDPDLKHHHQTKQRNLDDYPPAFRTLYRHLFGGSADSDVIDADRNVWDSCRRQFRSHQQFYLNGGLRADWVARKKEHDALVTQLIALGLGMVQRRQHQDAVALFKQMTETLPTHRGLWNNLGGAWEHKGELEQSLACYRRALELGPGYQLAAENLERVERLLGESVAANGQSCFCR